jgi:hypothetical protein
MYLYIRVIVIKSYISFKKSFSTLSLHFGFSVLCGVLGLVDAHVPFPHPFLHPAVTRKSADTHSHLSKRRLDLLSS